MKPTDYEQSMLDMGGDSSALDDVTPEQREAIEHEDGPMLVLAGAGSGKTRVITRRIARLIEKGTPPRAILSITFTNKAAGEMAERVTQMVSAGKPWVSTFHSFCARVLREDIEHIGYSRSFTIFDEDDALAVVKRALLKVGAPEKVRPQAARSAISSWKSKLQGPDQAFKASSASFQTRKIAEAYGIYVKRLKEQNALDFDDLLLKALELLRVSEQARDKWSRRFRHIQVDEYQDTNKIQFELVKILAGAGSNLTVVGDPDQSIYSWRGADPKNIEDFLAEYRDSRVVRLASNFRSTQSILDAASALIAKASGPRAGALTGVRGPGEPAHLLITEDETHEAREVASRIGALTRSKRSPRDVAVFYRTNAQSRGFEEAMIRENVPYALVGAVAFYQRREVKDVMTYLRVSQNRADDVGFRRIVNTPRRGIGSAALASLQEKADLLGVPLGESIRDPNVLSALSPRAAKSLLRLDTILGMLAKLGEGPAGDAVAAAVSETGLRQMFENQQETERVENLDELVSAATEYDNDHPGEGLSGFIEQAALVSDLDMWDETPDRVTLMTFHAAKGLEFKVVFVTGIEDGLLPHARSLNAEDITAIDEERRLLYVGMTRAEDELVLTCARSRRQGGQTQMRVRSRFLDDVPTNLMLVEDLSHNTQQWQSQARPGMSRRFRSSDEYPVDRPRNADLEAESRAIRRALAAQDDFDPDNEIDIGDRVRHPKFGLGKVIAIKGAGMQAKITIDFDGAGRKMLAAGFANLSKA